MSAGQPDLVAALEADSTRAGTQYTAAQSGYFGTPGEPTGVWKSVDGGVSWHAIGDGLRLGDGSHAATSVLAVSATAPDTVYAGGQGLHRSADGGANWTTLLNVQITAIGLDPSDASRILVGGRLSALLSEDGGAIWSNLGSPFDEYSLIGSNYTLALVFAPSDPTVVYAGLGEREFCAATTAAATGPRAGAWEPL